MPVIKSAIKKLRKDIKRTKANDSVRHNLDLAINSAKKAKTSKSVVKAISLVDRAVGNNLLHKNKAARIKSSLSKLAKLDSGTKSKTTKSTTTKPNETKAKKTVSKSTTVKKSPSKSTKSKK